MTTAPLCSAKYLKICFIKRIISFVRSSPIRSMTPVINSCICLHTCCSASFPAGVMLTRVFRLSFSSTLLSTYPFSSMLLNIFETAGAVILRHLAISDANTPCSRFPFSLSMISSMTNSLLRIPVKQRSRCIFINLCCAVINCS